MKDFWTRVAKMYPTAFQFILTEARRVTRRTFLKLPKFFQIGICLQIIAENDKVSPAELVSELFAPSGDFTDNACQLIEEFMETLEDTL